MNQAIATMYVKGVVLFLLGICILIPPPIRSVDINDMRAAQTMRIMKNLRRYLNLGNDANHDDLVRYAYAKLTANSNLRRKKIWMENQISIPKIGYPRNYKELQRITKKALRHSKNNQERNSV